MISQWKGFLLEKAAEWDLPQSGKWSFLFNNNYHPHASNLNLLWFHDGDEFPRVVTKAFRDPQLPKREFENLQRVYSRASAWVPKPLHFGLQGQFWTLWMEGVPGMRFRTGKHYAPAMLRSVVEAVARMHGAVRNGGRRSDLERYRRMVSEPLQTVGKFGASDSIRAGCAGLAARCSAEWVDSLPVIPQHGDLFFSNILSDRGKWRVVDWESFGTIDLPFYDLFTFLLSLLRAGGETPGRWDPSLVKQAPVLVECYAQVLGLSPAAVPLLLPLTLANWFHLQRSDGRKEFTDLLYKTIEHYFEHPAVWERAFLPAMETR